jgi:hypothetical protein
MDSQQRNQAAFVGAVAGAILGGIARFLVAISFVMYVHNWGSGWWGPEIATEEYVLAAISGAIGIGIGALSGATCQPVAGAASGAGLSACCCIGLVVVPAHIALGMSERGKMDGFESPLILAGMVAMTLAGAFAGGVGGMVGRWYHQRRAADRGERSPDELPSE